MYTKSMQFPECSAPIAATARHNSFADIFAHVSQGAFATATRGGCMEEVSGNTLDYKADDFIATATTV